MDKNLKYYYVKVECNCGVSENIIGELKNQPFTSENYFCGKCDCNFRFIEKIPIRKKKMNKIIKNIK